MVKNKLEDSIDRMFSYKLKHNSAVHTKSFGDNIRQHYRNDVLGVIRTTGLFSKSAGGFFRNLFRSRSVPVREAYRSVRFL